MECLWYNGELGVYELLDFDPQNLSMKEVQKKALKVLKEKYPFNNTDMEKVKETVYILDTKDLKHVF